MKRAICTVLAVASVTTGAAVGAAAVTSASVPSSDGTISACRAATTGVVRIIDVDAGQRCQDRLELPITWNQQGPAGPAAPAASLSVRTRSRSGTLQPGETKSIEAPCELGEQLLGGGYRPTELDTASRLVNVFASHPFGSSNSQFPPMWIARAQNNATVPVVLATFAICSR